VLKDSLLNLALHLIRLCLDSLGWLKVKEFTSYHTGTPDHKHDTRIPDLFPALVGLALEVKDPIISDRGEESNMRCPEPLLTISIFKFPRNQITCSNARHPSVPSSLSLSSRSSFWIKIRMTALQKTKNAVLPGLTR